MADLLVPLYALVGEVPRPDGFILRRAIAYERGEILRFVRETFSERWESEASLALGGHPLRCFIAIKGGQICGFACYDCTFHGFFGPTGVHESARGHQVGQSLLLHSLHAMKEAGYAYAVIGDVADARRFYEKSVKTFEIADSEPGAYHYDLTPSSSMQKPGESRANCASECSD